jgi:hypothetical protein
MEFGKMSQQELEAFIFDQENLLNKARDILSGRARLQHVLSMLPPAMDATTKKYGEIKRLCMDTLKLDDFDQLDINVQSLATLAHELKHALNLFLEAQIYVQSGVGPASTSDPTDAGNGNATGNGALHAAGSEGTASGVHEGPG